MIGFLTLLLKLFFCLFQSKKHLVGEIALLRKELEILKRRKTGKRIIVMPSDRVFFTILNKAADIRDLNAQTN
jgi:hypothetical protein